MDFKEGHSATNVEQIEKSGIKMKDLALLISSVFQAQIFQPRFVHCDPHPANVHWREKNGKPQLVLLDHGLYGYKQIDDDFRITYAKLWKSLLMADIKGIKASCTSPGVEEMYPLLVAMLISRPFDEVMQRSNHAPIKTIRRSNAKKKNQIIHHQGFHQFQGKYPDDIVPTTYPRRFKPIFLDPNGMCLVPFRSKKCGLSSTQETRRGRSSFFFAFLEYL